MKLDALTISKLNRRIHNEVNADSVRQYAEGPRSNELLFQFLFSIGAHGAHVF